MDKDLANKFKLSRTLIDIGSSATFFMSAVLLIAPATRLIGATGLGASVAAFSATSYLERRYRNIADRYFQQIDQQSRDTQKQAEQAIETLKIDLDLSQGSNKIIENAYATEQRITQRLRTELGHAQSDRQKLEDQVAALSGQIEQLKALEASLMACTKKSVAEASELKNVIKNCQSQLAEFRSSLQDHTRPPLEFAEAIEAEVLNEQDPFILKLRSIISDLTSQLEEAQKPHRFPGSLEQSRIGNSIIDYYYQTGITLDGMDWLETDTGYKLRFYCDRNGSRFISNDLLNSNEASEKLKHLTSALNAPQFAHDERSCHLVLDIQMRRPRKKEVSEADVSHLFTPIEKLANQVIREMSRKSTVRIMGATGDGKVICARYLLSQILQVESWYTRLHDPQHGSAKDYWGIPKVSKSRKELKQALKAITAQMTEREASKLHLPVTLDILDEIDTQLDKEDKSQFLDLISRIRHLGMKLILIGQNPKVSRAGFQWADMEQMICFYQGSIALDAINSHLALEFKHDILTKQYHEISSVLQPKNEWLDDTKKHYFGLCVIPGKSPHWYELPIADTIEIECDEKLLGETFKIPNSLIESGRDI